MMDLSLKMIPHAEKMIRQFISSRFEEAGTDVAVLGVSGGLDSSLILELLKRELGGLKIKAFFLPCGQISGPDRKFARLIAGSCGIELNEVDISPIVDSVPLKPENMPKGNLMARSRMLYLYTYANMNNGLVIGTSNKSEILMGYYTKFGDGAADIYPIGDLFKTQVRELSRDMGIPREIIERPPSAGLVPEQTDEGEMGIPYILLDQILNGILMGLSDEVILRNLDTSVAGEIDLRRSGTTLPLRVETIADIRKAYRGTRHKRTGLTIPKMQSYTVGIDLRERW
jgi:NAD+ synthase